MTMSLIVTDILINTLKNKNMEQGERRLEYDRRDFSYDRHIPERRSGRERRWLKPDKDTQSHRSPGN
jgi:hypothetical protein